MNTTSVPRPPYRRGKLLLYGVLVELFLLALLSLLPDGSFFELRNYIIALHVPIVWLLNQGSFGGMVALLFWLLCCFMLMASFWAWLIYWFLRFWNWASNRFGVSQRHRQIAGRCAGIIAAVALVWSVFPAMSESPRPFTPSPDVKMMVDGNTAFALDLYQKLKDRPGNIFFSPISISTALAIPYAGARNQTATEIAKTMRFNQPETNLHSAVGALLSRLNSVQRGSAIKIATANGLWCQQDYPIANSFLTEFDHSGSDGYLARVDFKNSEAARNEINEWMEHNTHGRIKTAIAPGQLDSLTRLVLCNAIYFKGRWETQFKRSATKPAAFHVNTNEDVTVPMMSQSGSFKMCWAEFGEQGLLDLVELPYFGRDLSMIIILPGDPYANPYPTEPTLADVEQNFTVQNLHAWLEKLDQSGAHETYVSIPRFSTAQNMDLQSELKSLGMSSAFADHADFSGIDGTTNFYLSAVVHNAHVEVNEEGTEAVAVTWAEARTKGMPYHLVADHPFIFLIRDNASGAILFLGRIVDPTK